MTVHKLVSLLRPIYEVTRFLLCNFKLGGRRFRHVRNTEDVDRDLGLLGKETALEGTFDIFVVLMLDDNVFTFDNLLLARDLDRGSVDFCPEIDVAFDNIDFCLVRDDVACNADTLEDVLFINLVCDLFEATEVPVLILSAGLVLEFDLLLDRRVDDLDVDFFISV